MSEKSKVRTALLKQEQELKFYKISEFNNILRESNIPEKVITVMNRCDISSLEELTSFKKEDVIQFHGIGPNSINLLDKFLKSKNLSFA